MTSLLPESQFHLQVSCACLFLTHSSSLIDDAGCWPPHSISPSAGSRPHESLDSSLHLDGTQKGHLYLDSPHFPPGTCTSQDPHLNRINSLRIRATKKSHSLLSASWRARKSDDIIKSEAKGLGIKHKLSCEIEDLRIRASHIQGGKRWMSQLWKIEFALSLPFCTIQPSVESTMPARTDEC